MPAAPNPSHTSPLPLASHLLPLLVSTVALLVKTEDISGPTAITSSLGELWRRELKVGALIDAMCDAV